MRYEELKQRLEDIGIIESEPSAEEILEEINGI